MRHQDRAAAALVGAALAGTLLGCASAPTSPGGPSQPRAAAPATAAPAAGTAALVGKSYRFNLFIHCGAPIVSFAGRAWKPVPPVPAYPGPRAVNGTTTYTGYVAGTMTLVNALTLQFTADPGAVAAPFSVRYEPTQAPHTLPVCS